ncbi:hypothetical protein GZ77_01945 [Endozoicomonas montiporae]|uniref:Uncharacterized protein n=2 Tax=Endozoicomonas montiporae TaxID=1027273 RepID=A0A081NAG0_9GAMM|nr:hypothetical protein [Endozoicomonas montiporae]AMO56887.1 hypothetical protein EZMO1_2841 [Endozoicomonas montiporae CL-33]KEQ15433.1 hypothetical protein GZ77_01945 [Endozoicomonas montiporae]
MFPAKPATRVQEVLHSHHQRLLESQRQIDAISILLEQENWQEHLPSIPDGKAIHSEHLEQWRNLVNQFVSKVISASQAQESLNELNRAMELLNVPTHLQPSCTESTREQIETLRQRLQMSITIQAQLQDIQANRNSDVNVAVQQLFQLGTLSQHPVSDQTQQMIAQETEAVAREMIRQLELNLQYSPLDNSPLNHLKKLESIHPETLSQLHNSIEALSEQYTQTIRLDAKLDQISSIENPGTLLENLKTVINQQFPTN